MIAMMPPTTYSSHIGIVIVIAYPPLRYTLLGLHYSKEHRL